ncbi:MAG: zinc-dependent metalloprotease [Taibaiella sp.]|jgi:hypothetical protein
MIRNLFTKVAAGLMVLAFTQSYAGDNYWKKFDGKTAPSRQPLNVTAKEYNIFVLDQSAMRTFLFDLSINYDNAKQIVLPTPDQKFRSFHVWKTPMMEPGLADRYPEIQTFTAVADDDPNVTAKLDFTLFGFSALIYDGDKSYMVDPYNNEADGYYVAFYKKDYQSTVALGVCGVNSALAPTDNGTPTTVEPQGGKTAQRLNGSVRHVYRLALSCTGEWATSEVGPNSTKAQVLSKMTIMVNRINGYYERELSVHLTLIGNNDAVIYTNAAADPYNCDNNKGCLIGEVQANITSVIGPANYDIGHIVSTEGGGLAQVSSVCGGGKASAVSSGNPNNVEVILHEMGHQFGSNHTFSAGTGGCNGNGNESTAYEPGAGITIMSYAGLCAANDIGFPDDQYFHVSSLNEINSFLTTQGSSCGDINNGMAPVNIPPIFDSFYIPRNTPFELTAPVATAPQSGATIRYTWEQWDLGNFEGTEVDNGNSATGPLFRSYDPKASRITSYPEYTNVINSNYGTGPLGKGQRLPKVARTVRFKLTVRSMYQAWGTFQFMDSVVRLKVDANSSDFRVTSQASAETWNPGPGATKTITWDRGNTHLDSVKCGWVNIYLSLDDGATFPFLMVANAPNSGSYNVEVPNVATTTGRVKVKGAGNVFYDISKGAITITGDPLGVPELLLNEDLVVFPNPATDHVVIMNKNLYGKNLKAVMYNAIGQRVWGGELNGRTEISVGNMARGNYMIQVVDVTSGARTTHKVVLR